MLALKVFIDYLLGQVHLAELPLVMAVPRILPQCLLLVFHVDLLVIRCHLFQIAGVRADVEAGVATFG